MAPLNETTCIFYARGACRHGNSCKFVHQRDTGTNNRLRPVISARSRSEIPNTTSNSIPMREAQRRTADSLPRSVDSRHTVPCKFFSQLRGCQKDYCPFLHVTECPQSISAKDERLELDEDNVSTQLMKLQRPDAYESCRGLEISAGLSLGHL